MALKPFHKMASTLGSGGRACFFLAGMEPRGKPKNFPELELEPHMFWLRSLALYTPALSSRGFSILRGEVRGFLKWWLNKTLGCSWIYISYVPTFQALPRYRSCNHLFFVQGEGMDWVQWAAIFNIFLSTSWWTSIFNPLILAIFWMWIISLLDEPLERGINTSQ